MGIIADPSRVDVDKLPKGKLYSILPQGEADPFLGNDKLFLTPSNRFIEVQDHEPAASEILGRKYKRNDGYMDANSAILYKAGWVRITVDSHDRTVTFSWRPSASQIRELKNLCIENRYTLIDDTSHHGSEKVIYEPELQEAMIADKSKEHEPVTQSSDITFHDLIPIDYTTDWLDADNDDGLLNYQIAKRHKSLHEDGLPYRRTNSRRIIERAERRAKRPYLNLLMMSEARIIDVTKLDSEFMTRAENNPSLNLLAEDFFKKANRKKEIQYLIKKHYFPEFNLSATLDDDDITDVAVNNMIIRLKKENPETFKILFTMLGGQGIGPGEAMLYFIYNKAYIHGGFGKTGDIEIGNKIYECKAIQTIAARPNEINDLRLGGTVDTTSIVSRIKALYKKQIDPNYEVGAKGYEGAQGSEPIIALRTNSKTRAEFKKIESDYQKLAYEKYFELHEFIFLNNSSKLEEMGKIVMPVGKIKQSSIQIERITQNILKPVILKNK